MPVGAEGMDLTKTREDLRARLDDVSHGAMVMHHLNLAVSTLPGVTLLHSNGNGVTRWQFPDGRQLTVVPMNIADAFAGADPTEGTVDLGLLFDSVAQELTGILELFQPVAVVLNMSWVFLPCASVEEFEEVKDTEFSDYSSCTARLFEGTAWAHIDESVRQALLSELDPKTWITEALGSVEVTRVAFVGAAGNLGLDYSLLPAHWDGVTAATVQASPGFVGRYWNTGDVAVPGEWLAFQALDLDAANAPVVGPATVLSYAGTSYSAPATSLLIALDMMRQGDVCDYTPGRDSPLTFVPGANSHVKDMNREYAVARASCAPLQGP